ncbi:MAG: alpha/beta hydrolase [Pseudomonadota bacterium]|nr:alpha/beta hydrolase [Pseudomonadota bacterium]
MTGPVLSPTAVSGLMPPPLRFRALWFGLALLVWLVLAVPASAQIVLYPKTGQRFALLGRGEPTVIVLNGLASSIGEWMPVVRRVSAQTRVFVYERRGNGRSPVIASARGSRVIAEELLEMLDDLSIEGPYVLVGHSLGAVYAQTFARLYPEEVAGLLLVDPSVEQLDRFMMGEDEETTMPPMTLVFSPGAKAEFRGRRLAITDRDSAPPMPADIPVTVLSAGRNMTGGYSELQEQVTALQSLMPADSDDGRHLIVENSGHNIQKEAPHAIELEIARLVAIGRSKIWEMPRAAEPGDEAAGTEETEQADETLEPDTSGASAADG